jgi:uncharacterized membrane protein
VFFPAFFVYVFGAKCLSLIVVSYVFGLFSKGSFVCELLHIQGALQSVVVKGKAFCAYY